jgi:hypothetical protein
VRSEELIHLTSATLLMPRLKALRSGSNVRIVTKTKM